jgi:hypothetical protein
MPLPACLTEHRPLIEWNGHAPAPYVEAILVGVGMHREARIAVGPFGSVVLRKRIWLSRQALEYLTDSGFMRATVLREVDEPPSEWQL